MLSLARFSLGWVRLGGVFTEAFVVALSEGVDDAHDEVSHHQQDQLVERPRHNVRAILPRTHINKHEI